MNFHPLHNFPVIQTSDFEEAWDALGQIYVKPTMATVGPAGSFRASINECRLENVRLSYSKYHAPLHLEFPTAECFLMMLPIHGNGDITNRSKQAPLAVGKVATVSPDAGFAANFDDDFECLYLKIDKQALTQKLVALTGATVSEPLRVDLRPNMTEPVAKVLHQYVPVLVETLGTAAEPMPPWWISQTEQLLMMMFLCSHRHNYSHLLEGKSPDAAPAQIRRTEDYIEANWQRPITLEDLAEVSGVSAFSLFRAFKAHRGYSPLEFLERVRVQRGVG